MLGGGAALAIWGVSSKVPESVNFTETRNTLSINVKEKPRSGAIGAGIGMAVGGFIATAIGVRKMRTGHQRMDELDILGRDRGWRLSTSLRRPEMMLSFNW